MKDGWMKRIGKEGSKEVIGVRGWGLDEAVGRKNLWTMR